MKCFADDGDKYLWKVRAYDGTQFGAWSNERNMKVNSVMGLSVTEENGELVLENTGNIKSDVYVLDKTGGRKISVRELEGYESSFDLRESLLEYSSVSEERKKLINELNYLPRLNKAVVSVSDYTRDKTIKFRVKKSEVKDEN